MGKITGFLEYERETPPKEPVEERIRHYRELYDYDRFPETSLQQQAARCMDCGVPFCHTGCPLGNIIPDWKRPRVPRPVAAGDRGPPLDEQLPRVHGTDLPRPLRGGLRARDQRAAGHHRGDREDDRRARLPREGWIRPEPPTQRTGKRVAVVGSGPAGLACAQQLNRAGHEVTVFERADRIGGLLRYGIPDFKLEKWTIDRRVELMEQEGVVFKPSVNVGVDLTADELKAFDAAVLCGGATKPRDLPIPGRSLDGVHYAMDFLPQQNKRVAGDDLDALGIREIHAEGKHVIIIGGGDTGSDCVGTSNRHGAASVTQFELLPQPPDVRPEGQPWPFWPMKMRTSTSHEEGCDRHWAISTKEFTGTDGRITSLRTVGVEFVTPEGGGRPEMQEVPGSERTWPADLVLLAMGFLGPEPDGILAQLGVELDPRSNVKTDEHYMSSVPGVFAAGDLRRGQSLVVWAISEGREAACGVDRWLMGETRLPSKGTDDLPRV